MQLSVSEDSKRPVSPRAFLVINSFWSCAMVVTGLFTGPFLLQFDSGAVLIGWYYLAWTLAIAAVSVLSARLCATRGPLHPLRSAFVLQLAYFAVLFVLRDSAANVPFLLGLIQGSALGLYCIPYAQIVMLFPSRSSRVRYLSLEKIIGRLVRGALPLLSGWLIFLCGGYQVLFFVMAALFLAAMLYIFRLGEGDLGRAQPLRMRAFSAKVAENASLQILYAALVLAGISVAGILDLLLILTLFTSLGGELELGSIAALFPVISMAGLYLIGRMSTAHHRRLMSVFGFMIIAAGCLALANEWFLILVSSVILFRLGITGFDVIFHTYCYSLHEEVPMLEQYDLEYLVFKEVALGIGRVVAFSILLACALLGGPVVHWNLLFAGFSLLTLLMIFALQLATSSRVTGRYATSNE